MFTFSEAISFIVNCDTQEELDYFGLNYLKTDVRYNVNG